jgi:hypothetical protein
MSETYFKKSSITTDGEVVSETTRKHYNPFKEGLGYNFKYKSIFVKSYLGISLPDIFKDIELGRIYRISKMMYSDSNLLARRSDNKIVPLTRDDIQNKLGMHRTKFVPFWNKLVDNKIIKAVMLDNEYFCMNPLYYNSTTYLPLYLFITFQDELKDQLPEWVIEKYLAMKTDTPDNENEPIKVSGE